MRPSAMTTATAKTPLTTPWRLPLRARRYLPGVLLPVALPRLPLKVRPKQQPRPPRVPLKQLRQLRVKLPHPPKIKLLRLKARPLPHLPGAAQAIRQPVKRSLWAS